MSISHYLRKSMRNIQVGLSEQNGMFKEYINAMTLEEYLKPTIRIIFSKYEKERDLYDMPDWFDIIFYLNMYTN